jgi:hypothetical protein
LIVAATASVDLHRIAIEVGRIPDAGLYAAAKLVKKLGDEQARRVGAPLAGHHRRAIKMRTRDKNIRPIQDGKAILITGVPAGPWVWMTSGTAPHTTRRRKRGPMKKITVHHPGMRGRNAWTIVTDRAAELVPRIFEDLADRAVI